MVAQRIGVVLINWDGEEFTIPCIKSLMASTVLPWKIIVVDNASTDGSPEHIAARFPDVDLIRNDTNLGFTGGNNVGIRSVLNSAEYIWLLNNDTVVQPTCLERLLGEMEKDRSIASVTGKILYPPPDKRIWYAGAKFHYWRLSARHRGAGEDDVGQYDRSEDVPFISGCCMMMKKEAFETVGLFDDTFFAYSEDLDWCLRARRLGLRLRYVPGAILYHRVSASLHKHRGKISGGTTSPFGVYITNRNRLYIIRKHASNPMQWFSAMISHMLWCGYYGVILFIIGRWDKLFALIRSIRDGLITRTEAV